MVITCQALECIMHTAGKVLLIIGGVITALGIVMIVGGACKQTGLILRRECLGRKRVVHLQSLMMIFTAFTSRVSECESCEMSQPPSQSQMVEDQYYSDCSWSEPNEDDDYLDDGLQSSGIIEWFVQQLMVSGTYRFTSSHKIYIVGDSLRKLVMLPVASWLQQVVS